MYSSSSTSFDPFQYSTISTPNPTSIPFLHFPSPNFHHDNGDLLLCESLIHQQNQHQQILAASTKLAAQENPEMNMNPSVSKKATRINSSKKKQQQQPTPRKRSGKKDRHSKIYTAHGPRDRRMRLSLQIARKFFDLQDMLGFDKASKTIDWLFSKSKSAIKELTDNFANPKRSATNDRRSVSCSSESEVMSGIKLATDRGGVRAEGDSFHQQKRSKKSENKPSLAKESRDKARARARERTKEKLKIQGKRANPSNLEQLGPENGNQEMKSSPVKIAIEGEKSAGVGSCMVPHQMSNIDKYLGLTAATKSASIFDLSHPNGADFEDEFSGFQGNCDISIGRVHNNNRFSAIPDIKLSSTATGNYVHVENPNSFLMTIPTSSLDQHNQDQNLTSLHMASLQPHEQQNSGLLFMNFSSPSLPMSTALHSYFTENNFFSTPNLPIKYDDSLY